MVTAKLFSIAWVSRGSGNRFTVLACVPYQLLLKEFDLTQKDIDLFKVFVISKLWILVEDLNQGGLARKNRPSVYLPCSSGLPDSRVA